MFVSFQFSYDEWQEVYDILFQDRYASIQTHFGELLLGRCWAQQKVTWVSFQVRVSLWSCLLIKNIKTSNFKGPLLPDEACKYPFPYISVRVGRSIFDGFWWSHSLSKVARHSGCRCFTSDQTSMEPSDGPLAFLLQFAAFNLFFADFSQGKPFSQQVSPCFLVVFLPREKQWWHPRLSWSSEQLDELQGGETSSGRMWDRMEELATSW